MNYKMVAHTLGWVLKIEAFCMILPLLCAVIYGEQKCIAVFLICIGICLATGFLFSVKSPKNKAMYAREGLVTVALSWILMSLFGTLPFILSGAIDSFIHALFETVSGFTTTGASILSKVEDLPYSIIFWRSFTHWIGGMGVLVFLMAILPLSGSDNFLMMKAESTGPAVSKLAPRVKSTAKILYSIYIALTATQIGLLLLSGMDLFGSLSISFATAGTGGFGVLNDSVIRYTGVQQTIIGVFMLLFGIDFSFYYLIIMRNFKSAFKLEEPRAYLGIIAVSTLLICANCAHLFGNGADALRHSFFQVSSIITTTGFSSVNFDLWPELSKTILVVLMFIGACAGSTGGGMKVTRIMIMLKTVVKEIKIAIHPKTTLKITMNGRVVEHETVRAINVFLIAYFVVFVFSTLIISLDNLDFTTNFTAVAATINNIGPGLAGVGPMENFSVYSPLSLLVFIFDMLVGRLEVFPMLVLFLPATWKK